MVNWREEGTSALSICAFCYVLNIFSVVVFHTSMVSWRRGPWYMCILLYVKLLWCSSIPYIYGQLEGGTSALSMSAFCYVLNICTAVVFHTSMVNWMRGTSALSICAFCYMLNIFSVVVLHRSMVNSRSPSGALVYVHSAICETYSVYWYSIDLWLNWRRWGTCSLVYVHSCYI